MLMIAFAINLKIFDASFPTTQAPQLRDWVLPALASGLSFIASITRMTRSSMLDVVRQDYITTARAKGQKESVVIRRHALRNALIPVITTVGAQLGILVSGSVVVETIFGMPGLGSLMMTAINNKDFPIIEGCVLILAALICIINLHMGVSGAAVATVASQLISGILCLIYMMKKFEILRITKDEWKLSMPHIGMLCAMGVPMGLQYSITAIGSVILQTSVNTLGATAVAAVTAGSKVSMFFCCAFDALGTTMATYGGQNVGAKKLDRLGKGLFACSIFGIVYSIVAFIIMYFAGGTLCGLFVTDASKELLDSSREFLLINAAFFIPLVFVNVIRYMIQGMGFSTFAILSGVFEMIARTLMGIFIVPVFGFTGACFASPLAWIMADIFLIPAYFYVKRKLERTLNGEKTAAA